MTHSLDRIYHTIKNKLTVDHLKKITVDIINSFKNKKYAYLRKFIPVLNIDPGVKNEKLFSLLIRQYHPDRYSFILKNADTLYSNNDYDKLLQLHETLFFKMESPTATGDTGFTFEADYRYDKNDFGYKETNIFDDDPERPGETGLAFEETEYSFYEALNAFYFGGLDYTITESDLRNLDGELDLSDYDIEDLRGLEKCVYLGELNLSNNTIEKIGRLSSLTGVHTLYLSHNMIENIEPLAALEKLKVLDLSFNTISDIDVLEKLAALEYVNLIGNPVSDYSVVDRLIKKGVIVICEENTLL